MILVKISKIFVRMTCIVVRKTATEAKNSNKKPSTLQNLSSPVRVLGMVRVFLQDLPANAVKSRVSDSQYTVLTNNKNIKNYKIMI